MIRTFIAFIILSILFSCEPKEKTLIIQGIITNPVSNEVSVRLSDTSYVAAVDSLGKFNISIAFDSAQYGMFVHGPERSEIYLLPDSKLSLTLDTEQFDESITLVGDQAAPSNYLLAKYLQSEQLPNIWNVIQNGTPEALASLLDSITVVKNNLLTEYKESVPINFYTHELNRNKYEKINYFTSLLSFYAYNRKELPDPNDTFFEYRKEMDYNRPELLSISQYGNSISNEISVEPYQTLDWNNPDSRLNFFKRYVAIADSLIESEKVLGAILLDHIDSYKSYIPVDSVEETLDQHQLTFSKKDYEETKKVLSQIRALSPGAEVPDFQFATLTDEKVKLSDFKGNLIYIDLWATWCGPCIAEQPAMEVLVEQYKEKPVVFLAISTDSSPAPWKKMVADRNLAGTHVYAENAWQADIMQHFIVEGIPRYILLDQAGRIIDQNAPRPSGNISEILDQELEKI